MNASTDPPWDAMTAPEREQFVLDLIRNCSAAIRLGVQESNVAYALMQGGAPIAYQAFTDDRWEAGWHYIEPVAPEPIRASTAEIVTVSPIPLAIETVPTVQATNDEQLIRLWLHGRSPATMRAYQSDAVLLLRSVAKPLTAVTPANLQQFADSLGGAVASNVRTLSAVKSLFAFGHRLGYLPFDTGAALRLPKQKDEIASRILTEGQIHQLLNVKATARDHAIVLLFYATGCRINELCCLTWKDATTSEDGDGLLTVFGKGGKTRFIRVPASAWVQIVALRGFAKADDPIFRSTKGGRLDDSAVHRIVKALAKRAGVNPDLSAHWLRHAHASHALDRGAPVSLVQATLGHASLKTTGRYLHAKPKESSGRYLGI